jgi:hypothetical protein
MTTEHDHANAQALLAYFNQLSDGKTWLRLGAAHFTTCRDPRPVVQALALVRHPEYKNPAHLFAMIYRIPT